MTRLNATIAALVMAAPSVLLAMPAQASMRQFCDAGGTCFACPRGQPTCEIAYALSRATTPPSTTPNMNAILPRSPAPSPGPLYPERAYGAMPPNVSPVRLQRTPCRRRCIRRCLVRRSARTSFGRAKLSARNIPTTRCVTRCRPRCRPSVRHVTVFAPAHYAFCAFNCLASFPSTLTPAWK